MAVKTMQQGRNLPHLASRIFGTPLLMDTRKLDIVVPLFIDIINGKPVEKIEAVERMEWLEPGDYYVDDRTGIAIVPAIGSLLRRKTMMDSISGFTSYKDIQTSFEGAMADNRAKAILFQVDTFGGEAGDCFELAAKIREWRNQKTIWGAADIDALSAGYALISACSRVVVAPRGSVGSIGAVCIHVERSQQNEMLGVTYTVLRSAPRKAEATPYEVLPEEAAAKMLTSLERTGAAFADCVSLNRPSISAANALATEGQWYDAQDGLALNLVDGVGSYDDVFAELAASISPNAPAKAPPEPLAPPEDAEDGEDEPEENMATQDPNKTTAALPAPAPPAVTGEAAGNVTSLDAARSAEQAGFAEYVQHLDDMCAAARQPAMLGEFIRNKTTIADARKILINGQASATAAATTATTGGAADLSNLNPGASKAPSASAIPYVAGFTLDIGTPMTAEQSTGWDNAFGRARQHWPKQG